MYNIALFQPRITKDKSLAYSLYEKLYQDDIVSRPIIYTDKCYVLVDNNIPVFHTYYMRQHFYKQYVLVDYDNIDYIPYNTIHKYIVVYNKKTQDANKISKHIMLDITDNITDILKEHKL